MAGLRLLFIGLDDQTSLINLKSVESGFDVLEPLELGSTSVRGRVASERMTILASGDQNTLRSRIRDLERIGSMAAEAWRSDIGSRYWLYWAIGDEEVKRSILTTWRMRVVNSVLDQGFARIEVNYTRIARFEIYSRENTVSIPTSVDSQTSFIVKTSGDTQGRIKQIGLTLGSNITPSVIDNSIIHTGYRLLHDHDQTTPNWVGYWPFVNAGFLSGGSVSPVSETLIGTEYRITPADDTPVVFCVSTVEDHMGQWENKYIDGSYDVYLRYRTNYSQDALAFVGFGPYARVDGHTFQSPGSGVLQEYILLPATAGVFQWIQLPMSFNVPSWMTDINSFNWASGMAFETGLIESSNYGTDFIAFDTLAVLPSHGSVTMTNGRWQTTTQQYRINVFENDEVAANVYEVGAPILQTHTYSAQNFVVPVQGAEFMITYMINSTQGYQTQFSGELIQIPRSYLYA